MKIIDGKGRLFGKINVIDIFVVLIVFVVIFGAYYKFGTLNKISGNPSDTSKVTYTVQIKKVRGFVFNNVQEGDILFDKVSGTPIGTITKIEGNQAMDTMATFSAEQILVPVQDRFDIILTVEADGTKNNDRVYINRTYELIVNSNKRFVTKYFEAEGCVKEILKS